MVAQLIINISSIVSKRDLFQLIISYVKKIALSLVDAYAMSYEATNYTAYIEMLSFAIKSVTTPNLFYNQM